MTIRAFKGDRTPGQERNQADIYAGPFKEVLDDDGRRMERGRLCAVSDKTYRLYSREPYKAHFQFIDAQHPGSPPQDARPSTLSSAPPQNSKETREASSKPAAESQGCCGRESGTCC
jgi:hypothetical protein